MKYLILVLCLTGCQLGTDKSNQSREPRKESKPYSLYEEHTKTADCVIVRDTWEDAMSISCVRR